MRPASTTLFAALLAATTALTTPTLALADAERLVVDLVNEPTTLDPHLQWNPDSYYVLLCPLRTGPFETGVFG